MSALAPFATKNGCTSFPPSQRVLGLGEIVASIKQVLDRHAVARPFLEF